MSHIRGSWLTCYSLGIYWNVKSLAFTHKYITGYVFKNMFEEYQCKEYHLGMLFRRKTIFRRIRLVVAHLQVIHGYIYIDVWVISYLAILE